MSVPTRIKICGIRDDEALEAAVEAGADYLGFVHWAGSPRHIGIEDAARLAAGLPERTTPVSLFVDESIERMLETPFQWIQLHGGEDESTCRRLREAGHRVIRGVHFTPEAIQRWAECEDVDLLLVDGSRTGGTGESFDHEALMRLGTRIDTPLIIAGGLDPNNVKRVIQATQCWGVDVSSGVESERGRKDPALIRRFCQATRANATDSS